VDSHNDTSATGAELNELTDGSETTLHDHAGAGAESDPIWNAQSGNFIQTETDPIFMALSGTLTSSDIVDISGQSITTINDESAIVFSTPAIGGKKIHIVVEGFAEDKVEFRLIETPSVDEGEGTAVSVPFNKDRGSSNTSVVFDAEPVKAAAIFTFPSLNTTIPPPSVINSIVLASSSLFNIKALPSSLSY
ncbi:hypothetical protein LCGC14_1638540, partial [marine sediment metagenome]